MNFINSSRSIKSLINLDEGETGEIIQVRGKPETHRYLYGLGLAMGRCVSVTGTVLSGHDSTLTVKTGENFTAINKDIAQDIKVQVTR